MSPLLRLLLRRHRVRMLSWLIGIWALVAIGAPSYQRTYPKLADRQVLIDQMSGSAATRVLYGVLRGGRLGELVSWEIGTFAVLLGAVMAVLVAVAITRGEEENGTTELVRATGVGGPAVLRASLVVVVGCCVALGAGCSAILLVERVTSPELTVSGAFAFGAVVSVASIVCGAVAVLAAQVWPEASTARAAGLAFVGAAYALRAWADAGGPGQTRWFSPLGWKDVVAPYSADDSRPILLGLVVSAVLIAVAPALAGRRDHLAGLVRSRQTSTRRPPVRSLAVFDARAMLPRVRTWVIALALTGALFGGLVGSITGVLDDDPHTRDLMRRMTGIDNIVASWFSYAGLMVGVLTAIAAVGWVLGERAAEAKGWTEALLATGVRRRSALATRLLLAAGAVVVVLLAAAIPAALFAQVSYGSDHAAWRATAYVLGQAPAAFAFVGLTGLLLGIGRRIAPAAWAVVALAAALSFFGGLVKVPSGLQRLSLFDHAGDPVGGSYPWTAQITLLVVAIAAGTVGVVLHSRRDLTTD
ncbi:hypothetical protein [Calidifontibacter terrae]